MESRYIVAELRTDDLLSLAQHRHRSDWQIVVESANTCLLKAPASDSNSAYFDKLPCVKRWNLIEEGHLIPQGKTLPTKVIPALPWQMISTLLPVLPASARNCESYFGHASFSLVSGEALEEPSALLIETEAFAAWAIGAAAQRLERLKFACSSQGKTLTLGTPLPPIKGQSFYTHGQLLIPSGFQLPEYIFHTHLSESLKLRSEQIALLLNDETHVIDLEQFVPASRAAARLSSQIS